MQTRTMARAAGPLLATALLLTAACGGGGGGSDPQPPVVPLQVGDPLPDLTPAEREAFERGRVVFERRFRPSEGLGPFYNATSCASCHSTPVTGGSARLYRNFYVARYGDPTVPGAQSDLPGLPSAVVPAFGESEIHALATFRLDAGRHVIPHEGLGPQPVHVAQRNGLPIFGVGLFEAISDVTILAREDPEDLDGDGISGRANRDRGTIGRFGVKAQSNNIELFTRAPLQNQMGVTTNPFLGEGATVGASAKPVFQVSADPNAPTIDNDGVPDPELGRDDLGDLIAFTRFLAPPAPLPFDEAATRGEMLFEAIGCTACHVPELPSARGPVRAYTDLLLHDMGDDLADDMAFGAPTPSPSSPATAHREFRTQPLWGVSMHAPFLHDGRAGTLEEAVELHGGEGAASRDRYLLLTPQERADLIAFLEHL